jgi:hypothetical protein
MQSQIEEEEEADTLIVVEAFKDVHSNLSNNS